MFDAFIPTDDVYNRASIALLGDWPNWVVALCVLLSLGILALCWRNVRQCSTGVRIGVLTCRLLAIVILFCMFFEVSFRLEKVQKSPSRIAVLIDQSRSMSLPASVSSAKSRLEVATEYLKSRKSDLAQLAETHQLEFFGFGNRVERVAQTDVLSATQSDTDFLKAFDHLERTQSQRKLVGAIILSDGVDTTRPTDGAVPAPISDVLKRLAVPIHTVRLARDDASLDLAIDRVAHDDFAFVRNAVSFEVAISVRGHGAQSTSVRLEENGVEVAVKQLELQADKTDYTVIFELVPDTRGQSIFKVVAQTLDGEQVIENNQHAFVVQVIRDKIRVLQVVGRPSWDVRALRNMLKQNPNVDLISFFILRTNDSVDSAATHELSLIPFPTDELFYQELGSFDLVVFQNFTHRGFRMAQYLPRIRDFVKDGGGFVMIGGDQSFAGGGYANTPFASFLPVIMGEGDAIETQSFKAELTEVGRLHPITRLIQSGDENVNAWSDLRAMNGWNGVSGVPADADVLLRTPTSMGAQPFVAVRDFGRGRVLSVLGDDTWRWSFGADGSGANPHFYYRFWGNAIRWLIRDPALNRLKVSARSENVGVKMPVLVEARLSTPSFLPASDTVLNASARMLGQDNQTGPLEVQSLSSNEQGAARFEFEFDKPGEYLVEVSMAEDETVRAVLPVLVSYEPTELRRIRPNETFLTAISEQTGGRSLALNDGLSQLSFRQTSNLRVDARKDVPVWATWWVLALLITALGSEWLIRRKIGLV
jgi:uncharacterized membrane protein